MVGWVEGLMKGACGVVCRVSIGWGGGKCVVFRLTGVVCVIFRDFGMILKNLKKYKCDVTFYRFMGIRSQRNHAGGYRAHSMAAMGWIQ